MRLSVEQVAHCLHLPARTVERLPIQQSNGSYRWIDIKKYLRANRSTNERDAQRNKQRVYVIRAKTMGLLKIGVSVNPEKRMAALAEQAPDALELLCVIKGNRATEAVLHRRFRDHRVRGEWFHPHPDVLSWIEEQRA